MAVIIMLFVTFAILCIRHKEATKDTNEAQITSATEKNITAQAIKESTTKETVTSALEMTNQETSTEVVTEKQTEVVTTTAETKVETKAETKAEPKVYTGDPSDKTAPKILALNSYVTLELGDKFVPGKYIGYGDDIDKNPTMTVNGNVDTSKVGTYNVEYVITDASGNSNKAQITVNVVAKIENPTSPTESPTYSFSDFIKNYKNDNTSLGIDVSRWQGDIDFKKVKDAGCEFVIIRLGYYSGGVAEVDLFFKKNIEKAKENDLKIGIYYYSEDYSAEELKAHVAWIFDTLGDYKLDFPVVFDWEDFFGFEEYGISINDLNELYKVFALEVEKYGYDAMLYSSKNYLQNVWTGTDKYNVWLAHYTDKTSYTGNYSIWQKDCIGRIDGIDAYVDLDILYKK